MNRHPQRAGFNVRGAGFIQSLAALGICERELYTHRNNALVSRGGFWKREGHRLWYWADRAQAAFKNRVKAIHPDRGGTAKEAADLLACWRRVKRGFARHGIMLALILSAIPATALTLQWDANTEPDLQGYRLYIYGPTNCTLTFGPTNMVAATAWLPPGEYSAILSAFNPAGESPPTQPVFWTNAVPMVEVITILQVSKNLTNWVNAGAVNTIMVTTNLGGFYRASVEIKTP